MPLRRGDVSRVAELSLSLTLLLFYDTRCFFARRLAGRGFGAYWYLGSPTVSFQERKSSHARALKKKTGLHQSRPPTEWQAWLFVSSSLVHG